MMDDQEQNLRDAATYVLRAFGKGEEPFLARTPERFANYFLEESNGTTPRELLEGALIEGESYKGMVIEQGLAFHSLCEHHLLPFFGTADIAYIPNEKLVGLSKIPRLLRLIAAGPNLQERIAQGVADALEEILSPKGVAVVLRATHLCMVARGVRAESSRTITPVLTGVFLTPGSTARLEFLSLVGGPQ
jgi:GTP cyclohydrolase I